MAIIAVYRQETDSNRIEERQKELDAVIRDVFPDLEGIDVLLYSGPDSIRKGWTILDSEGWASIPETHRNVAEYLASIYS
jgi:hypothetical protein